MNVQVLSTSPYSSNVYLLPDSGILIDAGISGPDTIAAVAKIMKPEDLKLVILTHAHYDHSGAIEDIIKRSNARVAVHTDDAPLLGDNSASVAAMFGANAPDINIDNILSDGDTIPLAGGKALEVIHTPGHTPGGICLYEPESKVLFSGDTVFGNGGVGRVDLHGGDATALIQSIKRLTELDIKIVYPGHGEPFKENTAEAIKLSLALAKSLT